MPYTIGILLANEKYLHKLKLYKKIKEIGQNNLVRIRYAAIQHIRGLLTDANFVPLLGKACKQILIGVGHFVVKL